MSEEITTKERYYKNGKLWSRNNYKNRRRHGLCEWWDYKGYLYFRINYKNGKWYGTGEWFYENGNLRCRGNYKNENRHGLHECWYYNGTLDSKRYYFEDKQITAFEYDVLKTCGEFKNE